MNTSKLARYAELKSAVKEAETEMKVLNEEITAELEKAKLDEVETEYGKFYFTSRSKWTYPELIVKEEELLKTHKKEAEQKGTATREDMKILTFKVQTNE